MNFCVRPVLILLAFCIGTIALRSEETPSNWIWFLPATFSRAELSPSGRFVLMYRNYRYDPNEERNPNRKEGRQLVSVKDYVTRAFIWDLQTGNIVLAGPPDRPGAGLSQRDEVERARWTDKDTLLMMTGSDFFEIEAVTGKPLRSVGIHGALREASPSNLPQDFEGVMLFRAGKFEGGYQTLLWSYVPETKKLKRLSTDNVVNDLVITSFFHHDRNACTVFSASKETLNGFTYELDEAGDLQSYPLSLPRDWSTLNIDTLHLEDGEMLVSRWLESGNYEREIKLLDFRTSSLGTGSLLLTNREMDGISSLMNEKVVDALREAKGEREFASVADPEMVKILADLEKAFPYGSFYVQELESGSPRMLVRVNAVNRPRAWYIYDKSAGKLVKLLEDFPNLAEVPRGKAKVLTFEASVESRAEGRVALLEAFETSEGRESKGTIVLIEADSGDEIDFDRYWHYLADEGYSVVSIQMPWMLQLAIARADGAEAFAEAEGNAGDYLRAALDAVGAENPEFLEDPGKVHFCFFNEVAGAFSGLPESVGGPWGTAFLVDPRFTTGLPEIPYARIKIAESYPFDRFFDAKTWVERAEGLSTPKVERCVVIGRENNHVDFTTSEQIRFFSEYCKDRRLPVEVNRFGWGEFRALPEWKRWGSIVVGIVDTLEDRSSEFDRTKRLK